MGKQYQTITVMILGLLVVSFLGFYRTYFRLFPAFENTTWVVHFHFLTILGWLALLFTQATLAWKGKLALHRKVGRWSYLLVPLLITGFALITNQGQLRQKTPDLLGAVLFDGGLFIVFYSLAIIYRRHTAYHSRYMMLSALPFINPGLGRFINPGVSITVEFLLLLGFFLVAYFRKKTYQPYLVALGSFFVLLGAIIYVSMINPMVMERVWLFIWG